METKYYKRGTEYTAINEKIDLSFWQLSESINIRESILNESYFKENGYESITREQFMEAYIPLNKKLNENISLI